MQNTATITICVLKLKLLRMETLIWSRCVEGVSWAIFLTNLHSVGTLHALKADRGKG